MDVLLWFINQRSHHSGDQGSNLPSPWIRADPAGIPESQQEKKDKWYATNFAYGSAKNAHLFYRGYEVPFPVKRVRLVVKAVSDGHRWNPLDSSCGIAVG